MNSQVRNAGATVLEWCLGVLLVFIVLAFLSPLLAAYYYDVCHPPNSRCLPNMSQIAKAILSYTGEYDDYFPCTRAPGVANGMRPERGIEARKGPVPFGGATWVERIDPYVAKGSLVDPDGSGPKLPGSTGEMGGVFNCAEREKKWKSYPVQDYHSYGYNFLYLGLPWTKGNAPKTNPYGGWGFTTGVQRVSRVENTAETILLCESSSIWAFPPCTNKGRQLAINRTSISPRHNGKVNVAFCDGHCKSMDPTELVTSGGISKNGEPGRAENNWYWDCLKTNYSESSE